MLGLRQETLNWFLTRLGYQIRVPGNLKMRIQIWDSNLLHLVALP